MPFLRGSSVSQTDYAIKARLLVHRLAHLLYASNASEARGRETGRGSDCALNSKLHQLHHQQSTQHQHCAERQDEANKLTMLTPHSCWAVTTLKEALLLSIPSICDL